MVITGKILPRHDPQPAGMRAPPNRCVPAGGRCGAKSVKVVNRRREEDMAALKSEIDAAKEEGVEIHALRGPVEIIQRGIAKNA